MMPFLSFLPPGDDRVPSDPKGLRQLVIQATAKLLTFLITCLCLGMGLGLVLGGCTLVNRCFVR